MTHLVCVIRIDVTTFPTKLPRKKYSVTNLRMFEVFNQVFFIQQSLHKNIDASEKNVSNSPHVTEKI